MTARTVLISGASVAGPALAFWLSRRGLVPTLVERAPRLRGGGYDVDFKGAAAQEVLRRMDLLDEVHRRQTPRRETVIVDEQGEQVTVPPFEEFGGDVEIRKRDLTELLFAATEAEVEYVFDDSITAIRQEDDAVRIEFARRGGAEYDLVIGADGQHSRVRELAFGPESMFSHSLGMAVTGFACPNFLERADRAVLHQVPGAFAGVSCRADQDDMQVFLAFAIEAMDYDRDDTEQQRKLVTDRLDGIGWEVPRLLSAMRTAPELYFDVMCQITMDRWSNGRVALVGDAACCAAPPSGLGTTQALLSAYVLANELGDHADHARGFAEYERQLRPYVAETQHIGRESARWFLQTDSAAAQDWEPPATPSLALKDY